MSENGALARPKINRNEVKVDTYRGTGPGGQHRNKTDSAVRLTYRGIVVTAEEERSQHRNREVAWARLEKRVGEVHQSKLKSAQDAEKSNFFGGERSFTWTSWRDEVTNGRVKVSMKSALKGKLRKLILE